jgi:hypothetical protein
MKDRTPYAIASVPNVNTAIDKYLKVSTLLIVYIAIVLEPNEKAKYPITMASIPYKT